MSADDDLVQIYTHTHAHGPTHPCTSIFASTVVGIMYNPALNVTPILNPTLKPGLSDRGGI